MKHKKPQPVPFDEKKLYQDIMRNAKVVGISIAAAEVIGMAITKKVAKRVAKHAAITNDDLNRFIAEAAEQYNKDLAYFYQNRDKII